MDGPHVLVIGAGSVGRRHARNLAALGCRISAVDPREDRRAELAAETPAIATHAELAAALAAGGLDGAAVCSPTRYHVAQAEAALAAGLPVLLEKPPAMALDEATRLAEAVRAGGLPLLLGYTWRWWPPLVRARARLAEGVIGRPRHVALQMSAHLADWHPWEPLQDFFMAHAELGGGALLDESHWIDLACWFFGLPEGVYARIERISDLPISADDNVDMLLDYADGLRVSIHLDLHGRPHEKSIRFVGEEGTLLWSEAPNRIAIGRGAGGDWEEERFTCERNEMFAGVAAEFRAVLDGTPAATCTIADGLDVMRLIDAARRSHAGGRRVGLGA